MRSVSWWLPACRSARTSRAGAAYLSLPYDVMLAEASGDPLRDDPPQRGAAPEVFVLQAAERIAMASHPVLLAGAASTASVAAEAIRALLRHRPLPIVGTWEAAGLIPRDAQDCFFGRVGLFPNQPGDRLLAQADLVVTLGYEQVEYDPSTWNVDQSADIVHIHDRPADFDQSYQPELELVGDLGATVSALARALPALPAIDQRPNLTTLRAEVESSHKVPDHGGKMPLHPLHIIAQVQEVANEDSRTTVVCDVGSHYIWMGRHFYCYEPRRLLFSNGQQTLGVALPWAIATCLARPGEPVISMSGDGGFSFLCTGTRNRSTSGLQLHAFDLARWNVRHGCFSAAGKIWPRDRCPLRRCGPDFVCGSLRGHWFFAWSIPMNSPGLSAGGTRLPDRS